MQRILFVAIALAIGSSCGPIDYIYTVSAKARRAVSEATAASAARLAPYEYWSAVEYLQMAKEKAAYADYELAVAYGDKSVAMANDALRLANERTYGGKPPKPVGEEEVPPDLAPQQSPESPSGSGSTP